jgi:hypothetical protein
MSTLASIATIVGALAFLFGPPVGIIYRRVRQTHVGVEWLLTIHNYPHRPPTGHYWPQVLRERERDAHTA